LDGSKNKANNPWSGRREMGSSDRRGTREGRVRRGRGECGTKIKMRGNATLNIAPNKPHAGPLKITERKSLMNMQGGERTGSARQEGM